MNRFVFYITTFFLGLFAHIVVNRYLSFFGVGPDILLLLVIGLGFIFGPLVGETYGFLWGLAADTIGVSLFGHQCMLYTLAGFVGGMLRRRVDSERPIPQIVIACCATLFYGFGGTVIRIVMEQAKSRSSLFTYTTEMLLNALVVTVVFWALRFWVSVWRVHYE